MGLAVGFGVDMTAIWKWILHISGTVVHAGLNRDSTCSGSLTVYDRKSGSNSLAIVTVVGAQNYSILTTKSIEVLMVGLLT